MEKKLEIFSLEQLGGQPLDFSGPPSRTRRKPQPIKRGANILRAPLTNRTAIYVRNLHSDQDPEQQLHDDLRRCREFCKEEGFEVTVEYSDPKGGWEEFRKMMLAATGQRPPFDNLVVSNYVSRFSPHPAYVMNCSQILRKNGVTVRQAPPSA